MEFHGSYLWFKEILKAFNTTNITQNLQEKKKQLGNGSSKHYYSEGFHQEIGE